MLLRRWVGFVLLVSVALAIAGCGMEATPSSPGPTPTGASSTTGTPASGKKLQVVTTVAPLTNIMLNIGGTRIDLHGIIPEGTDSHTFEPAPSDAQVLAEADLIVVNGLHLETPTEKLAEANMRQGATLVRLGDNTITPDEWVFDFSFPKDKGDPNPHLWMNVEYAIKYAQLMHDQLVQADPANQAYYDQNLTTYLALLTQLDQGITAAVQTVPPEQRKLLTYHDSFAYFARHYNMTVIGAIQPADFKEPAPQEVAALIDQVKREQVRAIFGSEVFPSKVLDQIAKESGVQFVGTLRDDDLPGEKTAPNHTYVGMMLEDMQNMLVPLGGNVDALQNIKPDNTYSP